MSKTRGARGYYRNGSSLSKYPQINTNTMVSLGVLCMVVGGAWWTAGLSYNVGHIQDRVKALEISLNNIVSSAATNAQLQAQTATQLEVRLTRMEIMLQSVSDAIRDAAARDRIREKPGMH